MAQFGYTFDATQVEPNQPIEVLPAGDYEVMIVASEMKPTKDGTGQYLQLQLQVLNGQHQGATLFDRLNLINKNDKAEEIARSTLSAICRAVGQYSVSDSEQLHNRPLIASVKVRPAEGQYGPSNDIKGYKPRTGGAVQPPQAPAQPQQPQQAPAQAQPQQPPQQPQAQPASGSTPPWMAGRAA